MAATVNAQQGTADLRGRIVDSQQAVMPGVTGSPQPGNGTFRTTVSGVDGSFFIGGAMNPGVYQVEAMLDGFLTVSAERRAPRGRPHLSVDVTLELGGIEERLTVTAEAPLVDDRKEVGGNISAEEFVNTPSFNRSFFRLPRHGPGSCRRCPPRRSAAT